jgi:hypothetical protein
MCVDHDEGNVVVCTRVRRRVIISHKKVHLSTCWKLAQDGRPWNRTSEFSYRREKKGSRRKKKSRSKPSEMNPDL